MGNMLADDYHFGPFEYQLLTHWVYVLNDAGLKTQARGALLKSNVEWDKKIAIGVSTA